MSATSTRRSFLQQSAGAMMALGFARCIQAETGAAASAVDFQLALSAASLLRTVGKEHEQVPMIELPRLTREDFELGALVLDNTQFAATDDAYVQNLRRQTRLHRVDIKVLRVEGVGDLGPAGEPQRSGILSNYRQWIDIAAALDCPAIRVVWRNYPVSVWRRPDDLQVYLRDSAPIFRALCDYADTKKVDVLLANDRGPSAYPDTLLELTQLIGHPRFGLMPDVRGFARGTDRFAAMDKLMPHARAFTARCYDFDDLSGEDTTVDYGSLLEMMHEKHAFRGTIEIHYAGSRLTEFDGIRAARDLLLNDRYALHNNDEKREKSE